MRVWRALAAAGLAAVLAWAGPSRAQVYLEAPELAAEVKAGKLPPVEQRLPANPLLLEPPEAVGRFGGTWRMAMRASGDHASVLRIIGYENLVRWSPDWTRVIPNVAQSFSSNADATAFTFVLRRGLRWSDGQPFTAGDIMFWYEDVLLNPALTAGVPFWLTAAGKPVTVEKVDDFTVVFRFAGPHSLFLQRLAAPEGAEPTSYPRHFLARLLPRHNSSLTDPNWAEAFRAAYGIPGNIDDTTRWQHPEVPTLNAWLLTGVYGAADPLVAVRNPYYWKIDPAGQQLPYFDRVSFAVVPTKRDAADVGIRGGIDMQYRHVRGAFADEILAAQPDMRPLEIIPTEMNGLLNGFNLTHPDAALREVFNQRDFRVALSLGINRARIIREWAAAGEPWQAAPLPQSRYYHEQLARQYLDYDPVRANELLDALGYRHRDGEGRRLGPGGRPIAFTIGEYSEPRLEQLKRIQEDWRLLGIEAAPVLLEREAYTRRVQANDFDAMAVTGSGGIDAVVDAEAFLPLNIDSVWGIPWWYWYENPNDPRAAVPPAPVQKQFALYDAIKATTDPEMQKQLMLQILDIAADQFYTMGVMRLDFDRGVIRRNFRNVPQFIMSSWAYPDPAPTNPALYFMDGAP